VKIRRGPHAGLCALNPFTVSATVQADTPATRKKGEEPLMPVEVHVTGRVQLGRFAEFLTAAERWQSFRIEHGLASCKILQALSGEMNAVRMVFSYPELSAYESEEAQTTGDSDYARVASQMPFIDGTLVYEIYRETDS
jgi:hypothetical protein